MAWAHLKSELRDVATELFLFQEEPHTTKASKANVKAWLQRARRRYAGFAKWAAAQPNDFTLDNS